MTPGTRHILAQLFPGSIKDPGEPEDELASRGKFKQPFEQQTEG